MKTTACVRIQDSGLNSELASHCSLMRKELQAAHTNTVSLWASGAKEKKKEKFNTELEKDCLFSYEWVQFSFLTCRPHA